MEDGAPQPRTLSLFPEDRGEGLLADASIVRAKLSELQLRRPRQWGACWRALLLWRELQLDLFWCKRLGVSRKGTRWDQVLFVLVALSPAGPTGQARGLKAHGSIEEVARIPGSSPRTAQIRQRWPKSLPSRKRGCASCCAPISGFARDALMAWCENNSVNFLFGLAKNARLSAEIATELAVAQEQSQRTGQPWAFSPRA